MSKFKSISSQVDFPALERELLDYWYKEEIVEKYLKKNSSSDKKFSFLDGPITANNPMGVHHGWGRTYKDLWQRFYNMRGYRQRFQNGFDEQGLWVEVEVEKELGLKSKKDIENLVAGDQFKSLEKFISLCKERVKKYSAIQTEQSKRLGYFMDWDNSYHTSSDENNFAIWNYLKTVHKKGWLYKGRDSVPWCPRCGTAISQHEILTEEYQEIIHTSIYFRLPIKGKNKKYLLLWTTTPWTIPANVAVAVDPDLKYVEVGMNGDTYIVAEASAIRIFPKFKATKSYKGNKLVGLKYGGPFDNLPTVKEALKNYEHRVIESDPVILPISTEEGTGLVHIAPGAGSEDFALGKKENLPVVAPIDEEAVYFEGFGFLIGLTVREAAPKIVEELKKIGFLYKTQAFTHRYPTCWRCKTELVWRVVEEWYIAMDKKDDSGKTYREQMIEVAKKINWIPKWGLDRELDWLKNMHDWLISKKRYWGLSLPIWECIKCGNFEVIGGKDELKGKAIEGWKEFEGKSPHRPWIDQVKIKCSKCNEIISRIPDVGNPWLDAGIVPFSTMPSEWFPAKFITEAFPGQFKNWFYSLIAMSTALKRTNPFENLLGHALVRDEKGEEMHKSKGNAIEFNEAADKMGVDIMRWLYLRTNPEHNVNFGYNTLNELRRLIYLRLWNVYVFFITYANLENWTPKDEIPQSTDKLDRWIFSRMVGNIINITGSEKDKTRGLVNYNAYDAAGNIEIFIHDLSNWYVRRIRDRVSPDYNNQDDKSNALQTLWFVLKEYSKVIAPFMPFISEEIYKNLTSEQSVHLAEWPEFNRESWMNVLEDEMKVVQDISEIGHAIRKETGIKLRQPLASITYSYRDQLSNELEKILAEELNVKSVGYKKSSDKEPKVKLDTKITPKLKEEGEARELIRSIQQSRKDQNLTLLDRTKIIAPHWPKAFEKQILLSTASTKISKGKEFKVICE